LAILGGAVLLLLALLALSDPHVVLGAPRLKQTLIGGLTVAIVVFVLLKAGLAWLAVGLVLLWTAAKRFRPER
jgi:hypothetical protein